MIKRGPIAAIGIIVLVLLAAPFAIGMINENSMNREIERMSDNPALAFRITSFDRGWFSTRATVEIGIDEDYLDMIQGGQPDPMLTMMFGGFTLPIVVEFGHGPILLDDGFALGTASVHAYVSPESQLATLAQQFLGMPYVVDIRGRGGFFGSGFTYEGEVPPIDFASPDMSLNSTGITFAGTWKSDASQIEGELVNLSLQSPFASAIVESIMFSSDTTRSGPDAFPLGTGGASIGRISVTDPLQGAQAVFSFEDFSATGTMAADDSGELMDLQAVYRFGLLSVPNQFEISDAAIGINMSHIDMQAANEFYVLSTNLTQTPDPEAQLALMMPIAERVLANDPVISIDPFEFSMPEGDFDGRVMISFDSTALPSGQITDLEDPNVARAVIDATLDLSASKPLAHRIGAMLMAAQGGLPPGPDGQPLPPDQVAAMLEAQAPVMFLALAAQGFLSDDGDAYSTTIRLENGQVTANGQILPIPF